MYDNIVQPVAQLIKAPSIKPPGLCHLYYTPFENVLTWPQINPQTGGIDDEIILKPGTQLFTAEFNPHTMGFTEETKKSSAGTHHEMIINATLPGNLASNVLVLDAMLFHKFLVVFEDRNGDYRFLGNADSGAELSYQYTTGIKDGSRNRQIKFTWAHPNAAPIYLGTLTDINITGGSFIMIDAFKVQNAGTPMITNDTSYTNALLADKKAMVFQDGRLLPPLVNDITMEQYISKDLSGDTITWHNGGVGEDQIIVIYGSN